MIDFLFIQFYIRKKYDQSPEEYFGVKKQTVSDWRISKTIPGARLKFFIEKEGSVNVSELISEIYKK